MRQIRIVILTCVLAMLAIPGIAQSPARKIKPADRLIVQCKEESALSKTYKVTKDGVILVDFLGAFSVEGLTEDEASVAMSKKLVDERILKSATVKVQIEGQEPSKEPTPPKDPLQQVKVSGAVANPGAVNLTSGTKLSEIIKLSNPTENADLAKIEVKSADGSIRIFDLSKSDSDIVMANGDQIQVPVKQIIPSHVEVYVMGGVLHPGSVSLSEKFTVRHAIEAAGGFVALAVKQRVRIERNGQSVETLDLTDESLDKPLLSLDKVIVDVTESRNYVQVSGAVNNPGFVVLDSQNTLTETLKSAGGLATGGQSTKIEIRSQGQKKPRIVNFDDVQQGFMGDIKLKAGDEVFVPGKNKNDKMRTRAIAGAALVWFLFGR